MAIPAEQRTTTRAGGVVVLASLGLSQSKLSSVVTPTKVGVHLAANEFSGKMDSGFRRNDAKTREIRSCSSDRPSKRLAPLALAHHIRKTANGVGAFPPLYEAFRVKR